MATPFFRFFLPSGQFEASGGTGNEGGKGNKWEIYHLLMQIYPGYTVARIEEELSWREIDELGKQWKKHSPNFTNLGILKEMAAKHWGFDLTPQPEPTVENTIEAFKLLELG